MVEDAVDFLEKTARDSTRQAQSLWGLSFNGSTTGPYAIVQILVGVPL